MPITAPTALSDSSREAITARCTADQTQVRLTLRDGSVTTALYHGWSDKHDMARVVIGGKHQLRRLRVADILGDAPASAPAPAPAPAPASEPTVLRQAAPTPAEARRFSVTERFGFLHSLVDMVVGSQATSLIVTGPGGLGKSFSVTERIQAAGLKEDEDYKVVKGFSTPKSLYRCLYENIDGLVIFDDCDSVLEQAVSLNMLKGALDSYDRRRISWLTERPDDTLPDSFDFNGKIIFISNKTIDEIDQPVLSRSLFIDLTMTVDEKIERLGMLVGAVRQDIPHAHKVECLELIKALRHNVADLNIRTLLKVIGIRASGQAVWRDLAEYSIVAA